jgi:predicted dehydrogenase
MQVTRRRFLQRTALAGAALSALPLWGKDAEGRYSTALIGCGWWGKNILGEAMASPGSRVVALCDVDQRYLDGASEIVQKQTGRVPRTYTDYRELIAKEKPEIVIVATPDHWHALITIEAVKNGCHVYVEKPISHCIAEGQAMVRAARKYGRVVQVGTHRRVSPHNISGMKFLRSGKAGKIGMVRCFVNYGGATGMEKARKNEDPPKELDWDKWCGPAPRRPFNTKIHPRGFRQFLDYANGTIGDWGIHWFDQLLWWSEEKWPRRVFSTGGRPILGPAVNLPDWQTTDAPDSQVATFEFESFTATWEHRRFGGNNAEKGEAVGCYFYGTQGTFHMGWQGGWTFYPVKKGDPVLHEDPQLHTPDSQNIKELWADFIAAINSKRLPVCDIEIGQQATNMSLLAMISYRTGRSLQWDGRKGVIVDDDYANLLLRDDYQGGYIFPDVV